MKQKGFVLGLFGAGLHTVELHNAIVYLLKQERPYVIGSLLTKPVKNVFTTLALNNTVPTEELIFTPGSTGGSFVYFVGSSTAELQHLTSLYSVGIKEHPKRFPSALELTNVQSLDIEYGDKTLELRYGYIKPTFAVNNFTYLSYGRKK